MLHKPCLTQERTFFEFPDDEQQRKTLLRFLNCSDAQEFKLVLVCALHFSDHVINKNEKRFLLIKKLKHVPLIASPSQMFLMGSRDNDQTSAKTSKGKNISGRSAGRIQEIEYYHKFGLSMIGLWVNVVFLKKNFTEATTRRSRTDAFFSLTEALMWKFIIKEL